MPTAAAMATQAPAPELVSLSRLSADLELLLLDPGCDAEVVVDGGAPVGIHRCLLAARSSFFRDRFSRPPAEAAAEDAKGAQGQRPRYEMSELVPHGRVGREPFLALLGFLYTGKLKPPPPEASTCVDDSCGHVACRPVINFAVELMRAASAFRIDELASHLERHLLNLVEEALVEDVIPVLLSAFQSQHSQLLNHCIHIVAGSCFDNLSLEKELPPEVVCDIKSLRSISETAISDVNIADPIHERSKKRIYGALDSDDVDLLKLLLTESYVTLDDATALHYAAAYCDPSVVAKVLELGVANVNFKNERGYTPLHLAAMRREPAMIISLLRKGASAFISATDGRSAVRICRRLTKVSDYYEKTEQGQEANKDRICIDILEQELRRDPVVLERDESVMPPLYTDDLQIKYRYLETRVELAKQFFPTEAKLAMKISETESTSVYLDNSAMKYCGNLRDTELKETLSIKNERQRLRLDALMKTVELGRRYFPHCSQVVDRCFECDMPDLSCLKKGAPEEQKIKRKRFYEFKEDIEKALLKDKAENIAFQASSSTSLRSPKRDRKSQKAAKKCQS